MNRTLLVALFTTLVTINCSSRPMDPAAAPAGKAAPLSWVRYDDPSERSFSIEVPRGWTVEGGMYRFGYFDVRATVDLRSPDGNIILRFDDANVPPYVLPGPNKPPEGRPYKKPFQFQMMVEKYRTAPSFAETYGKSRFKSVCQTMTSKASSWKPTLPPLVTSSNPDQSSDGAVDFDCQTSAGPKLASVFIHTALFAKPGFWQADPILSAVTTPDLMPLAQSVLQHAMDSFQIYPEWQAHQKQMTQEGLAMVQRDFQTFRAQTRAQMESFSKSMNQQVSGFERQQQASQAQSTNWGNILTGLTDTHDPLTGENFQVWTGPKSNYYVDGLGNKVNATNNPGGSYRELEIPPQ